MKQIFFTSVFQKLQRRIKRLINANPKKDDKERDDFIQTRAIINSERKTGLLKGADIFSNGQQVFKIFPKNRKTEIPAFSGKKHKVLMFGWELPPYNSGGLGVACAGILKALIYYGNRVLFVLPQRVQALTGRFSDLIFADMYFWEKASYLQIKKIGVHLYPYISVEQYLKDRKKLKLENLWPHDFSRNLIDEVYRYALEAKILAQNEDFEIIHAHDWLSIPAGVEAKRVSKKPLIVHIHSTEIDRTGYGPVNQAVYDIERNGMYIADKIIAVSNYTKKIIVEHYGIDPNKVQIVHNGIEASELISDDVDIGKDKSFSEIRKAGNKIVLYVGRLTLQKGPDYFLQAAKRVLEYYPKVMFIIAGSGDMEHQIMQQAAYLGISNQVIFAGFLRGKELKKVYRAADLFVMPSVSEPFGITGLEALINGTPVIVSKQSGVSEVLTHALKVDFWDIEEMVNKIVSVLYNKPLHECLRLYGKQEAASCTWEQAAVKCMNLYDQLVT